MSGPSLEVDARQTLACPTCRAVQEWSETCRRCKSDLRLVRDVEAAYRASRRACLEALRLGRHHEASLHALRCRWLRPDRQSAQLLAVCALSLGDCAGAARYARIALAGE